jgi:hypothetical protein
MRTPESFHRGPELRRERRGMPAATYNLTRILLARASDRFVFVPVRSMQVLAIVEPQEFNFVHSETRRTIDISWQDFAPGVRAALDEPVPYDAVYHTEHAAPAMLRLQGEFLRALEILAARSAPAGPGGVIDIRRR